MLVIIIICCIFIILGVGGYIAWTYFNKNNEDDVVIVTDPDKIQNSGNGTVIGQIEKSESDNVGDITEEDYNNLESNRPYLLHQTSIKSCEYGKTYGVDESSNDKMFVSDGCGGVFYVKSDNPTVGFCQSGTERTTCSMNKTEPKADYLVGLDSIKNISVIKDLSDGKCTNNAIIENGKLYVSNGCKGYFKIGALQGYCHSEEGEKKECYFGKTQQVDENAPYVGLRAFPIIFLGDNKACEDYDPADVFASRWGLLSNDKMFAKDGCSGEFRWGYYQGNCSSTGTQNVECKIGSDSSDNLTPFV